MKLVQIELNAETAAAVERLAQRQKTTVEELTLRCLLQTIKTQRVEQRDHPDPRYALTTDELNLAREYGDGKTASQLKTAFSTTYSSVERRLYSVCSKLRVKNLAELRRRMKDFAVQEQVASQASCRPDLEVGWPVVVDDPERSNSDQ